MDMWICRLEKKDKARAHGEDGQPRERQDPSTGEGEGREDQTRETSPKHRGGGRTRQERQYPSAREGVTDIQLRHDPSAGDAGIGQKDYIPAHGKEGHT